MIDKISPGHSVCGTYRGATENCYLDATKIMLNEYKF